MKIKINYHYKKKFIDVSSIVYTSNSVGACILMHSSCEKRDTVTIIYKFAVYIYKACIALTNSRCFDAHVKLQCEKEKNSIRKS